LTLDAVREIVPDSLEDFQEVGSRLLECGTVVLVEEDDASRQPVSLGS
jgi:hypothetical protein